MTEQQRQVGGGLVAPRVRSACLFGGGDECCEGFHGLRLPGKVKLCPWGPNADLPTRRGSG